MIADPDADVDPIHERLDELTEDLGAEDSGLPHDTWPLYGSLIMSLRHIIVTVDDVASARSDEQD